MGVLLFSTPARSTDGRQLLQAITDFPPGCKCDRTSESSPYQLVYDQEGSTPISGFNRHCFYIQKASCNASSVCCNASSGVYKVELDVVPACKQALKRVTVDGNPYSAWEFNAALGMLRVTRLNLTEISAPGTQICYFLKNDTACSTLAKLCALGTGACKYSLFNFQRDCCPVGVANPPPPPPSPPLPAIVPGSIRPVPPAPLDQPPSPPRSDFPDCVCERDPDGSRLYLKPNITITPAEKNLTSICFTVGMRDVCSKPELGCCEFTLYKLEFEADAACAPALAYSTVDGERRMRLFQFTPYPAIKVTGIGKDFSRAPETEVCLFMKPRCNTLQQLGAFHDGTITVGIANKPGSKPATCCPLFYAGQ
ncbi:extracellular matrix glycoprotein pherophorin-V29 [Volvox carteri f. nagariensis]|uniref:Extracellular matrix glycoprotein pherophorin-V29 n=1 Tax=Volvox carteri f. nagariensis TaxID=3068 RepID=D8UER4_VOLCA|nr:extracellular matrix glycoprotein pherophorin-V29 [Volvox carteri f. nagariensis]EFJ41816.1 extracellular matrix glycoprotein pherophorin-V29 [Volvox carteri f. nagariensis]|eukprot:XP_002957162.1 extracellular matrix glycoprotein pherophorin-V29 [Volvox carteri f. nagariensis]